MIGWPPNFFVLIIVFSLIESSCFVSMLDIYIIIFLLDFLLQGA